ncbi:21962_t:CDS:2, partial [Racocetra persica]
MCMPDSNNFLNTLEDTEQLEINLSESRRSYPRPNTWEINQDCTRYNPALWTIDLDDYSFIYWDNLLREITESSQTDTLMLTKIFDLPLGRLKKKEEPETHG